jgi:hypothetical protein
MRLPRMLAAVVVGISLASGAHADDASIEAARAEFNKGVELFEKDDFLGALDRFEKADKEHHSPVITYNIARAKESLGQAQAAYEAYEAYVSEAGAQGDFLDAASVAIARLKTRTTRLRVETTPAGAAVRVDGTLLKDPSPTAILVFRGHHHVEVQLGTWTEGRDAQAEGTGNALTMKLDRPPPPAAPVLKAPPPKPAPEHKFGGMTFGLGWSLNYSALVHKANFQGAASEDYKTSSIRFGLVLESGYAFTPRHAVLVRGHCGLGSDAMALFSLGHLTAGLSWRATNRWWLGMSALLASVDKKLGATYSPLIGAQEDKSVRVTSDAAVGPMLEAGIVLGDSDEGQWVVSLYPSVLIGTQEGHSTMVVPLALSYRWY